MKARCANCAGEVLKKQLPNTWKIVTLALVEQLASTFGFVKVEFHLEFHVTTAPFSKAMFIT